jgi:apolipoprotein N-acyltransferase
VENRIGLVRSANTGISAFVDPLGRITRRLEDSKGKYREVAGCLTDHVILDNRQTFYTQHGDIFGWVTAGWIPLFLLLRLGLHWVERDRLK